MLTNYLRRNKFPHIGAMDRRITLQAATQVQNAISGEVNHTFADIDTVWAAVDYPSGGGDEKVMANRYQSVERITFTFRYVAAMTTKINRVVYGLKNYDVLSFEILGRNAYMRLHCEIIS